MAQMDAKSLDHSDDMKEYYERVKHVLIRKYEKDSRTAEILVDRYFSLEVDPLERSLVMHREPEEVAADLAQEDF
jgi:hypothetical protein